MTPEYGSPEAVRTIAVGAVEVVTRQTYEHDPQQVEDRVKRKAYTRMMYLCLDQGRHFSTERIHVRMVRLDAHRAPINGPQYEWLEYRFSLTMNAASTS